MLWFTVDPTKPSCDNGAVGLKSYVIMKKETALAPAGPSACGHGVLLGYDRDRREVAEKDRAHLISRVSRAHNNASQWAPLLCLLLLAHSQTQAASTAAEAHDVTVAACLATFGLTLHKLGLLLYWRGTHWEHAVGFLLQTVGLLWLTVRLIAGTTR
jgi:hypothetical protein